MNASGLIQWKLGIWGAIIGTLCAFVIVLAGNLLSRAPVSSTLARGSPPSEAEASVPSRPGEALTLAEGEAGIGVPDGVSTRGRMQLFVVAAHLANDDFDRAVALTNEMSTGIDRDSALLEIAEKIVPRKLTMSLQVLPEDADERAALTRNLVRIVDLAKRASDQDLAARLLVRAAILKRRLDKTNKGVPRSGDQQLNPDELLSTVSGLARKVSQTPSRPTSEAGTTVGFTRSWPRWDSPSGSYSSRCFKRPEASSRCSFRASYILCCRKSSKEFMIRQRAVFRPDR